MSLFCHDSSHMVSNEQEVEYSIVFGCRQKLIRFDGDTKTTANARQSAIMYMSTPKLDRYIT